MKTYSFTSPSLTGVLSDDYLYFEGANRPQEFFMLRDGGEVAREKIERLEVYFNDIYNLFLRKITAFAGGGSVSDEETLKLQALLQELIKVRQLIENAGRTAIMGE